MREAGIEVVIPNPKPNSKKKRVASEAQGLAARCESGRCKLHRRAQLRRSETTTDTEHHGAIPHVPRITIVEDSTGVESDGTCWWTSEVTALGAMMGLPVGGSDPLAFYSAFPNPPARPLVRRHYGHRRRQGQH